MALNFKQFFEGIRIKAKAALSSDTKGELEVLSSDGKLYYHNGSSRASLVSTTSTDTLTNKTITGATITSPSGITKSDVGLSNVDNTSDSTKNSAVATLTNKTLTAPVINSPTGIVKADVGLSNVDNTSDATKNSATVTLTNKTLTAPVINSPTGLVKADVGLSNVDNTSDATKDAATATLTNKTLTSPVINSPTGITKSDVGLANVDNTSDATKNSAVATLTNKTLTAPVINSPTGITKSDVGLGNVDNTSDATKNSAAVSLTNKTINASLNTISNITNAEVSASAAIARTKLASGTANALQANDGSGVLSDITDITVSTNRLTLANTKHIELQAQTDSATTGSNASLAAFTAGGVRVTNGSLASLANIPAGANGQEFILFNRTGVSVTVKDSSGAIGTAANRILTGTGADITLASDSALILSYDSTTARWQVVGGSGGGSGAATSAVDNVFNINDSVDPTKQINFDAAGTTGTKTTIASSQTVNRTLTLPDNTGTLVSSGDTGTVTSTMILNGTILNTDINASAAIDYSKLAALSSANILVGSAGNVATSTAVTGDVTISNTGVTAIGATKVTNAMLAGSIDLTTKVTGALPIANGGTGQTTATASFNALSPQTTNGDLISRSGGTDVRLAVGTETQVLRVVSGAPAWSEEDRANLLLNPNFEGTNTSGVATSWTNSSTGSTPTITTTSGEFSEGLQAQKIALSSGVLNFFQSQNTPAGIIKQGVVGVTYRAGTATAGFQVCSLVDGVEQVCIPTANLIIDDTFHTIEIPVVFGATSAGIKLKSTSSTSNVFIDNAYVKRGFGSTNLQLDTVYSAQVDTSSVVTNQSKAAWITSCTNANPTVCTITGFTVAPNCVATATNTSSILSLTTPLTSTSTTITIQQNSSITATREPFSLVCQKQGADYTNSSAQVYSQASADYSYVDGGAITITAVSANPTKGTIVTDKVYYSRYGQKADIIYHFHQSSAGTSGTGDYIYALPAGLTFDSTYVVPFSGSDLFSSSTASAKATVGVGVAQSPSNQGICRAIAYSSTSFRLSCSYGASQGGAVAQYSVGSTGLNMGGAVSYGIQINAAISGWSNANQIVGSFAGYNAAPGVTTGVDVFSLNFGTTNDTTDCTGSPCFTDQIGTAVSSMTRSGTGAYTLNLAKTYTKLKCNFTGWNGGSNVLAFIGNAPIRCTSCSTVSVSTEKSGSATDSHGLIMCQGTY